MRRNILFSLENGRVSSGDHRRMVPGIWLPASPSAFAHRFDAATAAVVDNGKTEGTILMPFGLKLDSGALLTLDNKDFGAALRFSTCTPEGCLLPVLFPAASIEAMKKAKTLAVASLNLSSGEVVAFKLSLDGFAPAIARIVELGK
jgi:invasion protein IalB